MHAQPSHLGRLHSQVPLDALELHLLMADESPGKTQAAQDVEHWVSRLNKQLTATTVIFAGGTLTRLVGGGALSLLDIDVRTDVLALLLYLLTLFHGGSTIYLVNDLYDVMNQESQRGHEGASPVLAEIQKNDGWFVAGLRRRSIVGGKHVLSWRDPSAVVGPVVCLIVLAGAIPWRLDDGTVEASASLWTVAAILPAIFFLLSINWKLAAAWMNRLAELEDSPGNRPLTRQSSLYVGDSISPAAGFHVFSGWILFILGCVVGLGGLIFGVLGAIAVLSALVVVTVGLIARLLLAFWRDERERKRQGPNG